jgi:radical SAM protein with 4Fe4S-binding SPASM domain
MAYLMNEVIINAEGNLFKCIQCSANESDKIGDCKSGIVFNQTYLDWLDVSIKEPECIECTYLPLCNGGCKGYRALNKPEITPCAREKDMMNTVLNFVHEWAINDGKILDKN